MKKSVTAKKAEPAKAPEPAKTESRNCFGLAWFKTEEEAEAFSRIVQARGDSYNGGFFHGMACGRDKGFDYRDEKLGQLYAVSVR